MNARTPAPPKRRSLPQTLLVWLCLLIPASGLLYGTSAQVRGLEKELNGVRSQIAQEHEQVRVLHAEWAYLNNPRQLAARATRYLGIQNAATAAQVVAIHAITEKIAYRTPTSAPANKTASMLPTALRLSTNVLAQPIAYGTAQSLPLPLHQPSPNPVPLEMARSN